MMSHFKRKILNQALVFGLLAGAAGAAQAQDAPVTDDDATVTYPASFFTQYEPFSVNDMLDRIPGINVARGGGGGGGGGPGFSGGNNRRGLGMGGDQVLINGRRIAGKENEGSSQLARISASQVDYIEIIRGTSGDLDVRGGNQVINIVLLEAESRSSITYEVNTDHYHDDALKPGGKIAWAGSQSGFDYLISAESEPRYEHRIGHETSILGDGSPNERIKRVSTRKAQPLVVSSNLAWQVGNADLFHLNLQYENDSAPEEARRDILNTQYDPPLVDLELDLLDETEEFWEVGGDFEHIFSGGQRWKTLLIVNRGDDHSLRDRYLLEVNGDDRTQDLHINFANTYQERILRSGYTFDFPGSDNQSLELGIERAQTILDSNLQLDLLSSDGAGVTPASFSDATVEEIRYESFAVHNWQINDRMSLESTLIFEQSEISQSGDVSKTRDFEFLRPKVDYRFDITPALQFRATVEKDVAQLSFSDFTENTSEADDDQDSIAGNPDLRQEQSWRYDLNLEYRFNDDNGVLNTNVFYHEIIDLIDKLDVSTPDQIQSANGNIGDGERYGVALDGSYRFASIADSQILLTSRLSVEDSSVIDPFLGIDRRFSRQGRGEARIGFRHDFPARNFNYGFNWSHNLRDGRIAYDIDKIEDYNSGDFVRLFAETQGWGELIYRFEVFNPMENKRCRVRSRYLGGTIATGYLSEIEDSCSHTGPTIAIKIRGTI